MLGTVQDVTKWKRTQEEIQRNYDIQTVINDNYNDQSALCAVGKHL